MKLLFTIFLFFIALLGIAQNLVPNPSFEQYSLCPPSISSNYSYLPTAWNINVNSADYFNICAPSITQVSIPNNGFGYQYPFNGNAYCGFYNYTKNLSMIDSREYLGTELLIPLVQGIKYYISFRISMANTSLCATNHIGILFTNIFWGDTIIQPTPLVYNIANFYTSEVISDTADWVKVSGSYIADTSYKYIMIGNFFESTIIDSVLYGGNRCISYYFIDDVCVSQDSLTCNNSSFVKQLLEKPSINVYSDLFSNKLIIESEKECSIYYEIINELGNIKKSNNLFINGKVELELNELTNGFYIIKIRIENKTFTKKFINIVHH